MPPLPNLHATAIVIGDRGVLIRGPSGSGKTTLALALLADARARGRFAALVADDQVLLSGHDGRLACIAPSAIAGLVEVRGASPRPVRYQPSAIIDLVVTLVEADAAPRFSEPRWEELAGCRLPALALARRTADGAFAAIAARLLLPPFD